ncbi:M48 family metalloprotease [bacterium]|nr:M48 family metalloprotease [bacterium]MCI0607070.1 M48 family metalloprotease [bacterium]
MKPAICHGLVLFLIVAPIVLAGCAGRPKALPQRPLAPEVLDITRQPYAELFEEASRFRYTSAQLEKMKDYLDESKDYCVDVYENRSRQYENELRSASGDLYMVGGRIDEGERHQRHCQIQNLRILKARADILSDQAIPVAYDNRKAKVDLIQHWPAERQRINQELSSGSYRNRRWANVNDIGYRVVAEDQEDDVKTGLEAIIQLRRQGAMPPELESSIVQNYVSNLTENLAKHSDLQVPVKVTVLNSKEINAFALPGGFLFINRGLLEAADNEAEVAGVISHEIAHAAARHGHKLQRKANMANILIQAARIAGAVAGSPGLYYGLNYGAMGLGLALNLNILGKSREFELEADQLGVQYAWHAGYDPRGFSRFFDKMATEKGYASGASWFRTHPPFYERMVGARREITFLTERREPAVQTDEFSKMRAAFKNIPLPIERMDPRNRRQQTVMPIRTEGCPPPHETQNVSGGVQYLEDLCRLGAEKDEEL